MASLGKKLKEIRESRLLSLAELSKKSGLHVSTLSKIESGDTTRLRFQTARRLAEALEMNPAEFAKEVGMLNHEDDQEGETDGRKR